MSTSLMRSIKPNAIYERFKSHYCMGTLQTVRLPIEVPVLLSIN